jgi:hypothetical protein
MIWQDIENRVADIAQGVNPDGGKVTVANARDFIRQLLYRMAYYELAVEELGIEPFNPGGIKSA